MPPSPVMLAIDVVLGALIGPPGTAAEMIIARAPGTALSPPSLDEIEHWRDVVFGRDSDDADG